MCIDLVSCSLLSTGLFGGVLFSGIAYAQGPIQIPASPDTYGPEGPWNAVRAYFGSNQLDLFPGSVGFSYARSATYCDDGATCGYQSAGFYANSTPPVGPGSDAPKYADSFSTSPNGPVLVPSTYIIADIMYEDTYPNGLPVNRSCGLLDIVPGPHNETLPYALYGSGLTPSVSASYHIGSAKANITPSVWYGGYDASRIVEEPIFFGLFKLRAAAVLSDISILTLGIAEPLIKNMTGLLASGNSTIASSGGLTVVLTGVFPFLQLPPSVCNAITSPLPVTFDGGLSLYLWDTSDPLYEKLMSSPTYLAFTFKGTLSQLKVPLSLLSLTLESPFPNAPVAYFPCNPEPPLGQNDIGFMLGRSFMQAVTIGINKFQDGTGTTKFFLAQAPGPDYHAPDPIAIVGNALNVSLKRGNPSWEQSWINHWKFNSSSSTNDTTSGVTSSMGLSSGAKAGIGVGTAVGALLILTIAGLFVWYRHRQLLLQWTPSGLHSILSRDYSDVKRDDPPPVEMDGQGRRAELDVEINRSELDDSNQIPAELE